MNMVSNFGMVSTVNKSDYPGGLWNMRMLGNELSDTGISGLYFTQKEAEMEHAVYSILINFC